MLAALAAVAAPAGLAHAGWGVADLTEIKERVSVKRSGESAWETAEAFSILNPGDEIKTVEQGRATLYFWPRSEAVALGRESHLRLEKGRYVVLKGTVAVSAAAGPSSGTVGTTMLRGGAPDAGSASGAAPDPLRARVLWMEGRLEEADREFESSLRGGAHP
ncbi:MAG: hypothetical protein HY611_05690, partial [Elusimicrobia bacterium]|nr:hypothetical protein [Elusimicrobiota bacterium]